MQLDKIEEIKKKIFKEGKIELTIEHSGMRQRVEFILKKEPYGKKFLFYLATDRAVDSNILVDLAEKLNFPIQGKSGRFFPKNKKASDFLI